MMKCKECGLIPSPDSGKFYSRDGVGLCAAHYQAKYARDYSDPKEYEAIICRGCDSNIAREYSHYC
jgi:hypothetical protein